MTHRTHAVYKELQTVTIPADVPELGIESGTVGTIVTVYSGSRMLDVEVGREDGTTVGFVDLGVRADGALHVVAYTLPSSR